MNEIFVASIAFAAYLLISALRASMTRIGLPVRTNGSYSSCKASSAARSSPPRTTRSGFMKSSTAAPSFKNSGLETTAKGNFAIGATASLIRSIVPTGAVLLLTKIFGPSIATATARAVASTCSMFARPSAPCGVPTAMKTIDARRTASARSVVNDRRCSSIFRCTSSSSPGS
jgi:hypothetical protein